MIEQAERPQITNECTKESSVHIDNRGSIGQHHILTFLMVYTHCYISSDVLGKERLHYDLCIVWHVWYIYHCKNPLRLSQLHDKAFECVVEGLFVYLM